MLCSLPKTHYRRIKNGKSDFCGTVLILTLAKHRSGVWITELVTNMKLLHPKLEILITDLEHHSGYDCLLFSDKNIAIINRVSDAAPYAMAKRALTLQRMADLQGTKVLLNGFSAYAVGMSKVAHHAAIHTAGCKTPRSTVITNEMDASDVKQNVRDTKLTFPILLKPNAAGFGVGIMRLENIEKLDNID